MKRRIDFYTLAGFAIDAAILAAWAIAILSHF